MKTKDWTMGHYPVPPKPKLNVRTAINELRLFNHHEAAAVLLEALIQSGGIKCSCALMLQHKAESCDIHPGVALKTREEMAAFATAWDAKVAK